jgi:hypothetical protein
MWMRNASKSETAKRRVSNRKVVSRLTRWSIFLPVVILSIFSPVAKAEPVSGLNVSVYTVDQIPPVRSDSAYPICPDSDTHYPNIQQGWGGGDVGGCSGNYDRVMIHYLGFITFPEGTQSASFIVYSDDGGYVNIAGNEFGFWGDRGCSGTVSATYSFSATQSYPIDAWYYENGGGTCFSLYWSLNNGAWSIVPASAFSIQTQPTSATSTTSIQATTTVLDTTTSSSTTTSTTTTTTSTIPPRYLNPPINLSVISVNSSKIYLDWEEPQNSGTDVERYAVFFSKDNWQSGWAIASYTTSAVIENLQSGVEYQIKIRSDNDTLAVYSSFTESVSASTSYSTTTTTTTTSTTTTTTLVENTTSTTEVQTIPQTSTSVDYPEEISAPTTLHDFVPEVEETSPETTETELQEQEPTYPNTTEETELSEETVVDTTFVQDTVVDDTIPVSEETIPLPIEDIQENQVLTDEQFDEVVDALSSPDVTPEEIVSIIEELISADLTQEQAIELVTNPQVLSAISGEQASALFSEVSAEELTTEQAEELVAAVQYAPEEVRETFEEEIDVFQGAFDNYIPTGSKVSVKGRRILNAVTATLFILSAPVPVTTASASKRS